MTNRGRPLKITADQRALLAEIVESSPTATLREIQQELERRGGVKAHEQTIQKALREAGFVKRYPTPASNTKSCVPTNTGRQALDKARGTEPRTYGNGIAEERSPMGIGFNAVVRLVIERRVCALTTSADTSCARGGS